MGWKIFRIWIVGRCARRDHLVRSFLPYRWISFPLILCFAWLRVILSQYLLMSPPWWFRALDACSPCPHFVTAAGILYNHIQSIQTVSILILCRRGLSKQRHLSNNKAGVEITQNRCPTQTNKTTLLFLVPHLVRSSAMDGVEDLREQYAMICCQLSSRQASPSINLYKHIFWSFLLIFRWTITTLWNWFDPI